MKKRLLILPIIAGMALAGCDLFSVKDKDSQDSTPGETAASVVSVSITGAKSSLALGATMQLSANVTVTGDAAKTVSWSTSASAKATVSSSGLVTAKGLGEVTITATSTVDSTKSASVTFTVAQPVWSATTKAMFEQYFEDVPPAFVVPSGLTWDTSYYETYGCLSAEGSGNKVSTVNTNIKAVGSYTYLGKDSYDADNYSAPCADPDYEWYISVYYSSKSSKTCIDVYCYPVEYETWPTEKIAAHLAQLQFTTVDLPSFSATGIVYSVIYSKLQSGESIVVIDAFGEKTTTQPSVDSQSYASLLSTEKYTVTAIEGGYQAQAKDKSHSIFVFDQEGGYDYTDSGSIAYFYVPGFEIYVTPYQPDYEIAIAENYEMVAVGESLDLTVLKGDDVPEEAIFSFASSAEAIATVTTTGHVEAVSVGTVTITASYSDKSTAEAVIYVVDSIPTAFTAAQQEEFDKIDGEGVVRVPFNKYFESVSFSESKVLEVSGKEVSHEIVESYYEELLSDGWVDENEYIYEMYVAYEYAASVEEAREMYVAYVGKYELSKTFDDKYVVYADLYATAYDEEEQEEIYALDGVIHLDVYDVFIYTYEEALAGLESSLASLGYEEIPEFPATLPASRYGIDADKYGLDFYAFDTEVTLELLKEALEANEVFECEIVEEAAESQVYDEESEEEEEAETTKVLYASALEGEFELSAVYYEDDKVLVMHVDKKALGHWANTLEDLQDGDEICLFSYGYGLGTYNSSKYFNAIEAVDEESYYDPDTEGLFHVILEQDGEVWHIKDAEGNYYGVDSGKNLIKASSPSGSGFDWTIEFDEDTYATFSATVGDKTFALYFNSGYPRFKPYDVGMQTGLGYYVYVYDVAE